jgi:hypothetical protein
MAENQRQPSLINSNNGTVESLEALNSPVNFYINDESSRNQSTLGRSPAPTSDDQRRVFTMPGMNGRSTIAHMDSKELEEFYGVNSNNTTITAFIHSQPTMTGKSISSNALSTNSVSSNNLSELNLQKLGNDKQFNEMHADLHGDERRQWEAERLSKSINIDELDMDPTLFQLFSNTTLLKVHSMFSILSLTRAYVTNCGRLIGVVSLRDVGLLGSYAC